MLDLNAAHPDFSLDMEVAMSIPQYPGVVWEDDLLIDFPHLKTLHMQNWLPGRRRGLIKSVVRDDAGAPRNAVSMGRQLFTSLSPFLAEYWKKLYGEV